ncbi:MAG TPA: hypothetical protein VFZ59_01870 [Verrucomicrobiae bacterium]|nr:hypothetical protein [Verrucomicrobiae bacterium]
MRTSITWLSTRFIAAVACLGAMSLQAGSESPSAAAILERASRSPQLSPAVEEVVKLSKAGVSDAVTVAYIQNSTTTYALSAQNVVQLQEQGVSPQVVTAMLQRNGELQRAAEASNQAEAAAAAAAAKTQSAAPAGPTTTTVAAAPAAPASTVSVTYFGSRPVPYYPSYVYHGPGFGYYYPRYYGYYGPRVAFGVGFGYPYRGYARCW